MEKLQLCGGLFFGKRTSERDCVSLCSRTRPSRPFTSEPLILFSDPAVNRHRTLAPLAGKVPSLGDGAFVAPSAAVIGDVKIGAQASIFYGSVIRGEHPAIVGWRRSRWRRWRRT